MLVRIPNAGAVGVNKDLSQHELPINAWTDAQNIRFLDGYALQFYGHGEVYNGAIVTPHHVMPVNVNGGRYWMYASLNKIFVVTNQGGNSVHTNITRQSVDTPEILDGSFILDGSVDLNGIGDDEYSATPNSWTSTLLGGIPIFNAGNTIDPPQIWDLSLTSRMYMLPNWPTGTFCRSLRSYKQFLIALGITKTNNGALNEFPYMVKWSHPADPGGVPISWAIDDPSIDAGEVDLAEGYDKIVDGLTLRDSFMIYKEASVWRMDYVGGQSIFSFTKVLGTSGALNRNCIVEIDGFHFVLTNSDVIIHDGQQSNSVLDKQSRRYLFQNIDVDGVNRCFVFKNPFLNEVFVCYPSIGSPFCDRAMVWNYKDKTVSFRDIPNLNHAAFGPVDNGLEGAWSQDAAPWASDLTQWNGPDFTPSSARVMMASNDRKLFLLDASASFNGELPQAYLERRGLSFDAPESMKVIRGIRPRIVGNTGDTVLIRVGSQDDPWQEPNWGPTMTHTIGTTVHNDCFVNGRYIAIQYATGTAYQWRLDSQDIDVVTQGMY